jgi:hypothetical protein
MSFRTIRSESFAPMFRGLSLMAGIAAIAIVLVMSAAVGSPVATIVPAVPASLQPASSSANAARWTDWRWGSEDGVYYIEYNWQPRSEHSTG